MSGARASAKQAAQILKLITDTDWDRDELQRRFIGRWGLLRDIAVALDDPQLSEDQVRAMHPLFYNKSALPTEITVGGRTYEILSFFKDGEGSVRGDVMVERAEEMKAGLGKEDCEFLLAHRNEIPSALRGKVVFVFPDYRDPGDHEGVAYVLWGGDGWYQHWRWLDYDWSGHARLLRRKAA